MTTTAERTEREKALSANGNGSTQSLGATEQVYCDRHGFVKGVWGHCEECLDAGWQEWDASRIAKLLIPSWTGINVDGRQVIVTKVHDALEAVQAVVRYKGSDAIVLVLWDTLITAVDRGHVGPNWVLNDVEEIECARCGQPFTPVWGDEKICDECALHEGAGA